MVAWPHVFGQNVTVAGTCDCHFLMDRRLRGLGELVRIAGGFFFFLIFPMGREKENTGRGQGRHSSQGHILRAMSAIFFHLLL